MPEPVIRSRMTAGEVTRVCARYELGEIRHVRGIRAGSRAAPKAILETSTGTYLLKRRAEGADDPYRVALSHEVLLRLHQHGFPVPVLVGTADENNSMVQSEGGVYELFRFVAGDDYVGVPGQTHSAGSALASFHAIMRDYLPSWPAPTGCFHAPPRLAEALDQIGQRHRVVATVRSLKEAAGRAASGAEALGYLGLPSRLIHSDWHPGNMLFHGGALVAVVDFDSVRLAPTVSDLSNGLLQFAIRRTAPPAAPGARPSELDVGKLGEFADGYRSLAEPVSTAEAACVPWLMIEALIVEAAAPILATGRFGRLEAAPVLAMVERKARWIEAEHDRISLLAAGER